MDHVAGRDPGAFFFQFTDFFAELSEIVFQYVRTHQKNDTRAVDLNNSLANEVGQITNSKHKIYVEYANCGCNEDNKVFLSPQTKRRFVFAWTEYDFCAVTQLDIF